MRRYRVTVGRQFATQTPRAIGRYDFGHWLHAWRFAHALRRSGYTTRTERI